MYEYAYGSNNELREVRIPGLGSITVSEYQWNRPTTMLYPGGSTREYEYDALMRLKHLTAKDPGGNALLDYSYEYDTAGNIVSKSTEHGTYNYGYDGASRLTSVENPTLEDEHYSYDAVGNRTSASSADGSITHNANNELTVYGGVEYVYDANGNMTDVKLSGQIMFKYYYNADNRLVKLEGGNSNTIAEYYYDPFGRRLWKEVAGVRTYFFYSDEGLIGEYDTSGTDLKSYGYKPDSTWTTDPLFLRQNGQYYFYQNDHLGTPHKLIAQNGAVVWSATYSAFGEANVEIETVANNLRFPGQYVDAETGLHYNFHRYYAPGIGRYLSPDPIRFAGGNMNLSVYANNNAVNVIDFLGLVPYPKLVEKMMREEFVPSINRLHKILVSNGVSNDCITLIEIATLKFLADEYSDRMKTGKKRIQDYIQDWVLAHGALPAFQWVYQRIDPAWKKGGRLGKFFVRFHPAYNDIGPANIEPKTALEYLGIDPATASTRQYAELSRSLIKSQETALFALAFAADVAEELMGHFTDKCCQYDRRSVELIVNRLREGEDYWKRVWQTETEGMYRFLMTQEQFEVWKEFPDSPELPELIKDWVAPLNPGELDDNKFTLLEELIQ